MTLLRRVASGVAVSRYTFHVISLVPWLLVFLLTALNLLYISRLGPNDDAFITYRVARNLAAGQGPVYNPGERVLSITTPGYAMLLAALSVLSNDFPLLGLATSGVALIAIGWLLIDLSRVHDSRPGAQGLSALAAIVAVSLTLTFPLLSEALGMETALYVAALLAAFAAYDRALRASGKNSESRRSDFWLLLAAGASAIAFLLRPDGALLVLALGLHWIVGRRPMPWRAVGLFALLTLPWLIFAWIFYGSPVPNTLVAKVTQGLSGGAPTWGEQLVSETLTWTLANPVAAVLALAGLAGTLRSRLRLQADRLPMLLWAVPYVFGHILLDVRGYFWYYAPLAAVVALLAGDGALLIITRLAARQWSGLRWAAAAMATALLAATLISPAQNAMKLATGPAVRNREKAYVHTGQILRDLCAGGDQRITVGMLEIGVIGYVSNCHLIDFGGLLQPDVAHVRTNTPGKIAWATKRYAPQLVVLGGGIGYPHQVADAAWFRQRYEPIELSDDGYRTVIFRRGLGPEQQRDLHSGWWSHRSAGAEAEAALYFDAAPSPAITLHAFLPPGSSLTVKAAGRVLAQLAGQQTGWADYPLPIGDGLTDPVVITLAGQPAGQPVAVAWIESNALPAVHHFAPLVDLSTRPRPTMRLDAGDAFTVTLAPIGQPALALEILHRDWRGVLLDVSVNNQVIGVVGGTDGWRTERLPLPDGLTAPFQIQLRNQGEHFARLAHVAVVPAQEGDD